MWFGVGRNCVAVFLSAKNLRGGGGRPNAPSLPHRARVNASIQLTYISVTSVCLGRYAYRQHHRTVGKYIPFSIVPTNAWLSKLLSTLHSPSSILGRVWQVVGHGLHNASTVLRLVVFQRCLAALRVARSGRRAVSWPSGLTGRQFSAPARDSRRPRAAVLRAPCPALRPCRCVVSGRRGTWSVVRRPISGTRPEEDSPRLRPASPPAGVVLDLGLPDWTVGRARGHRSRSVGRSEVVCRRGGAGFGQGSPRAAYATPGR